MARFTVDDCLQHIPNLFELTTLVSNRAKQILNGSPCKIPNSKNNKAIIMTLREIAQNIIPSKHS
jgi:DNA-directed RNA polymerase subunit omega